MEVFVGIGSNLGQRSKNIEEAIKYLKETVEVNKVSSIIKTSPQGGPRQPNYLNCVVKLNTTLSPYELLELLRMIEDKLGRLRLEKNGPRTIDLDILLYDGLVHNDGSLSVPHPELEKRRFVLVPLREIAPDVVHPVSGLTVEELAAECAGQGRIKKTSYKILV